MKLTRKILLLLSVLIVISTGLILIFSDIDSHLKIFVWIPLIISIILLRQLSIVKKRYSKLKLRRLMVKIPKREDRFKELKNRLSQCEHKQDLAGYIYSFQLKKGYKNSEVSDRCWIDCTNYIKIKNREITNLDKKTVIKIAYGLTMTLEETQELLNRAGYSFSESDKFDTIIQYCFEKNYDPGQTDEILWEFGLPPLFNLKGENKQDLAGYIYSFQLKKGYKNAEVCNRCWIDPSNYSKILNRKRTNLDKKTVIKIAYGLTMTLEETKILLRKAGYSFSESDDFDTVIQYCLEGKLDPGQTDEVLYKFGLHPLFDVNYIYVNPHSPT